MKNIIDLSPELEMLGEQAHQAMIALRKSIENWLTIGRFVVEARKVADERGGRNTFYRILEQHGFSQPKKFKSTFSALEKIMDHEREVIEWHRKLPTLKQQMDWTSPASVLRHCPLFADPAKPAKPPRQPAKAPADVGNARAIEQMAAREEELQQEVDAKDERIEALMKDVENLHSGAPPAGDVRSAIDYLIAASKRSLYFANMVPADAVWPKKDIDAIVDRLQALNKGMAKRRATKKAPPKPKGEKSPAKVGRGDDPLFDAVNAKLVAGGDPRRLTRIRMPLLGTVYALQGPVQPDGKRDVIEGGMNRDDLKRLAEELGIGR